MKTRFLGLSLLLVCWLPVRAQENTLDLSELWQGAQQWARENLDTNLLASLPQLDRKQVEETLQRLQQRFQGEYVVNLAAWRDTATLILPFLERGEETQPYAAWLKARLDYFKVAKELVLTLPPPAAWSNDVAQPLPNPSAARQREVWVKEVARQSWPAAASNHVARLKPIFSAEKVPVELVWIAEVESAFDVEARSPVGAAGLFQLMPETAKRFGLSLWPRDQRYQPDPSARAAAQYLKYLHDKFKDWRLALAAYNAGEGTVQRLLKRREARSYDDIAGDLPAETQMFVPKVEAVLLQREGLKLTDLQPLAR
jgi:membrane-bound lytic murein transglycosylase D